MATNEEAMNEEAMNDGAVNDGAVNDGAMLIDDDAVVAMHYRLLNGFGELIDGSQGELPLVYMHNTNALLPALERELTGRRAGEALQVTVYPEDGYGYSDETLIQEWPMEQIRQHVGQAPLFEGMRLKALGKEDKSRLVTVVEIGEDSVRIDGNHPLAGQVLYFEITVVQVRPPTRTEREQGYATAVNG